VQPPIKKYSNAISLAVAFEEGLWIYTTLVNIPVGKQVIIVTPDRLLDGTNEAQSPGNASQHIDEFAVQSRLT